MVSIATVRLRYATLPHHCAVATASEAVSWSSAGSNHRVLTSLVCSLSLLLLFSLVAVYFPRVEFRHERPTTGTMPASLASWLRRRTRSYALPLAALSRDHAVIADRNK